jgi:TRAP-type uncharacterized transport system substrate-binding protein
MRVINFMKVLTKLRRATSAISTRYYIGLTTVLVVVTAAWLTFAYFARPAFLRIAIGAEASLDSRMMTALEHFLEVHKSGVRLRTIATSGLEENYRMLEKGNVELAILRADQGLPHDVSVVMILRKNVLVIAAPSGSKLESFSDLKGKRLGLVVRLPFDRDGLAKIVKFYGMQEADIKVTTISPDQVSSMTDSGQLDAVMVIGAIIDPEVSAVVYAVDRKSKVGPSILSIDIASLADRNALAVSSDAIPQRAFPRRRVPAEDVDTISVPTILAGSKGDGAFSEKSRTQAVMTLARTLIERRMELSQALGVSIPIEAPDNEKGSRIPVHPGTAAYLESTDVSWYSLFSDQIWTIWLVSGALFSLVAALFGFLKAPKIDPVPAYLDRLRDISRRARANVAGDELEVLAENLVDLGVELPAIVYQRWGDSRSFALIPLAFENARFAIQTARERQSNQMPSRN